MKIMIKVLGCLVLLLPCVISDIKLYKISLRHVAAVSVLLLLVNLILTVTEPVQVLLGGVFGLLFLLISKITKESIGYGDSFILLVLGIWLGIGAVLSIALLAGLLAFAFGEIRYLHNKMSVKKRIPFIPFIGIASGIEMVFLWLSQ